MARRDNGMGTIYQRENGTWVGKITLGKDLEGKKKYKCFSGKTQAAVKRKIKEFHQGGCKTEASKVSVGEYIWNWAKLYKKGSIRDSSFDAIEKTIKNHIIPGIGMIQLQALTADDIQQLITDMKDKKGYRGAGAPLRQVSELPLHHCRLQTEACPAGAAGAYLLPSAEEYWH